MTTSLRARDRCAYAVLGDFHLAEDVSVDAFLAAYQGLGELREPEAFPGWLRRIVLRQCRRQLRRRRAGSVPLDAAADVASPDPGPVEVVEAREVRAKVLEALAKLPGRLPAARPPCFYCTTYPDSLYDTVREKARHS